MLGNAVVVDNTSEAITNCRDPKDNKFMELAVSGQADSIISGDDDLLVLNPFRGIPVLSSDQFLSKSFDTRQPE